MDCLDFPLSGILLPDKPFFLGADITYSLSAKKVYDYSYETDGWKGNLSPAIKARYGNKLADAFKAGYIRYIYEEDYQLQVNGAAGRQHFENSVHNIFMDLYLESRRSGLTHRGA